jgi:hypothetical protein
VNIQKREHVGRISPGNDHHARPAVAYDFLQNGSDSRVRVRLIAPGLKGRERSVIIKQQRRLGRLGNGL